MPETYYAKQMVVLLAPETTYGVDAVPVAASNALQLENVAFTPMTADEIKREWVRSGFGAFPTDLTNMGASLTGELVLTGAGAAGSIPFYDALMRCCGWASQRQRGQVLHSYIFTVRFREWLDLYELNTLVDFTTLLHAGMDVRTFTLMIMIEKLLFISLVMFASGSAGFAMHIV
jgi:hypothetical protein